MLKCAFPLRAILLLALACVGAGAARAANDPMVGDWKLNSQKSRLFDEMKVASLGENKYSFDFGGGHPEEIVVDGTDQPGLGGTTLAVTAVSKDEWTVVRKKDGRAELKAIWKLQKEGEALQDDYSELDNDGKTTVHVVYLYESRGGGPGFASDWVSISQQMDTVQTAQVRTYEGDGLSIATSLGRGTKNFKFDGKDYPRAGSSVDAATSAERVNERTIKLTDKYKGKISDTQEITVSEDGKTLTMTVHVPGRSEPDVLVFEKE